MLKADNLNLSLSPETQKNKNGLSGRKNSRLAINIHSMPKTTEKSHKTWFVLAGIAILAVVGLILLLLI